MGIRAQDEYKCEPRLYGGKFLYLRPPTWLQVSSHIEVTIAYRMSSSYVNPSLSYRFECTTQLYQLVRRARERDRSMAQILNPTRATTWFGDCGAP